MRWVQYDIRNMSNADYEKYYTLMDQNKRERVDRYLYMDDKKRTVAGEMLARREISQWCQVNESSITFSVNQYGKPYIQNPSVHFNISHSGDMVVCAIDHMPIGIDVEKIRQIDLSVAKRICTEREQEYLNNCKSYERFKDDIYKCFFEIWTLKEAYFKCNGTGITEFKKVDVFRNVKRKECIWIGEYVVSVVTGC